VESFDCERQYHLSSGVTLRPEPFGALAYHFGQRRLTYLASGELVAVLDQLSGGRSVTEAMTAAGIPTGTRPTVARALATLVERGVLDAV
jgi:mycofactocin biosynthesis protein MftB